MKILQVAHGFPPDQMAGAEVYTWTVSRELARRGHEVHALAPAVREGHPLHALIEEELDGVHVLRLNRPEQRPVRLEASYVDRAVDEVFADLLGRLRPDVVHVQHTVGLSAGILPKARSLGVPVVFTLHDFWYQCPRGQRLTPRGHLCTEVQPLRCSLCVGRIRGGYMRNWLAAYAGGTADEARGESTVRRALHLPSRLSSYVAREGLRAPILRRTEAMRDALLAADLLLAPSRFMLERFVEHGIPAERIEFSEYGMDDSPFRAMPPRPERDPAARPVRFGFVGTLMQSKAPDILLRAFRNLPPGEATLDLFGAGFGPGAERYEAWLRSLGQHPGLTFRGRFDNRRIAEILSGLDVLVVPSRWWENAPLTIHEAVMSKMPVVTADHGGMVELAERFGNAALFRADDTADLERALRRFLEEPGIWGTLRPRRAVRALSDDVDGLLERYDALRAR